MVPSFAGLLSSSGGWLLGDDYFSFISFYLFSLILEMQQILGLKMSGYVGKSSNRWYSLG